MAADLSDRKEHLTDEIGDLLFATASLARKLHVDPEFALRNLLRNFAIASGSWKSAWHGEASGLKITRWRR